MSGELLTHLSRYSREEGIIHKVVGEITTGFKVIFNFGKVIHKHGNSLTKWNYLFRLWTVR
jgi:hypothetical protein